MDKINLEKLDKSQLMELLLKQEKKPEIIVVDDTKPIPTPRTHKPTLTPRKYKPRPPIPTPRKNVKHMVQDYEDCIILPPLEFRDKPVPAPRLHKPVPAPRPTPVPTPRTK